MKDLREDIWTEAWLVRKIAGQNELQKVAEENRSIQKGGQQT